MTNSTNKEARHLTIQFKLKASVVEDFVRERPNPKLEKLRELLSIFGANVRSTGRMLRSMPVPAGDADLEKLQNAILDLFSRNPELAKEADAEISVQLEDDRNLKAFVSSLELGYYDDVIRRKTMKIVFDGYDENEAYYGVEFGIIPPSFPPKKPGFHFE